MQKVMIIGNSGAGKSTFARKLAAATRLPLYYLDMIWHKPDMTNVSREEFDCRLGEIIEKNQWIIDGNYQRTLEMRLKACDTVFFLDLPVDICLSSAKARVGTVREELPWVEQEFDEEFGQCIVDFPKEQLPQIREMLEKYKEKEIIIFKSREEIEVYCNMLEKI